MNRRSVGRDKEMSKMLSWPRATVLHEGVVGVTRLFTESQRDAMPSARDPNAHRANKLKRSTAGGEGGIETLKREQRVESPLTHRAIHVLEKEDARWGV